MAFLTAFALNTNIVEGVDRANRAVISVIPITVCNEAILLKIP